MSILDIARNSSDATSGGGAREFKPPREGVALLRLCSYIELGKYKTEWKGKEKTVYKCMVEFELVHPDHRILGEDGEFKGYHKIWIRVNKSDNPKSRYMQLFNCLNHAGAVPVVKGKIPSIGKFLGYPFMGTIYHNPYQEKVYANLDKDGVYSITAPIAPVFEGGVPTGKYEPVQVPEMHSKPRLFLWESPDMTPAHYHSMWESIYIEGEKQDGSSKNWIQEQILSAENIALPGSQAEKLFLEKGQLDELQPEADDLPF